MIKAGTLIHRIVIEQPTQTHGVLLGDTKRGPWTTFHSCWAAINPISGREYFLLGQVTSALTHRIIIRYHAGITAKMRVKFGTRIFEITSPPMDINSQGVEMHLMVNERFDQP